MSNYDDDWEYTIDEKKAQAKDFLEGMYALQAEEEQKYLQKKFGKKSAKYNKRLADAGFTTEKLQSLYNANPGLYDHALDTAFKTFNKVIKTAAKGHRGQPRAINQPRTRSRRFESQNIDMDEMRKKAVIGPGLRDDEMDAILDATLGDLFVD